MRQGNHNTTKGRDMRTYLVKFWLAYELKAKIKVQAKSDMKACQLARQKTSLFQRKYIVEASWIGGVNKDEHLLGE